MKQSVTVVCVVLAGVVAGLGCSQLPRWELNEALRAARARPLDEMEEMMDDERYQERLIVFVTVYEDLTGKSIWTRTDLEKLAPFLYSSDFRFRARVFATILDSGGPSFVQYEHLVIPFLSDPSRAVRGGALTALLRFGSQQTRRCLADYRYTTDPIFVRLVDDYQ